MARETGGWSTCGTARVESRQTPLSKGGVGGAACATTDDDKRARENAVIANMLAIFALRCQTPFAFGGAAGRAL
jgi:hypothetical protein